MEVLLIEINLDYTPFKRWEFAENNMNEINELVECYWKEVDEYVRSLERM